MSAVFKYICASQRQIEKVKSDTYMCVLYCFPSVVEMKVVWELCVIAALCLCKYTFDLLCQILMRWEMISSILKHR